MKNYNEIEVNRVTRTRHLVNQIIDVEDNAQCWDIDNFIKTLKDLDKIMPNSKRGVVIRLGDDKMYYSDSFIEELLKKEFINHLEENKRITESLNV